MPAPAIVRSDDVRKRNRRRILAAVRRGSLVSRTDIGRQTGLSAATVSAITSSLLQEGLLMLPPASDEAPSGGRGRPKVALAINPDAGLVGSVILQFNMISAALIDYAGETIAETEQQIDMSSATPDDIRAALCGSLHRALAMAGSKAGLLSRVAVGVQGITDGDGAHMLWSPITNERDLPIGAWLGEAFGVPVKVSNDSDLIAVALNWRYPERYGENFAAVLLSPGVGMGLFLNGRLANGTRSSGMEFGHMTHIPGGALCRCGRLGCVEAYAGDYAISRHAKGEDERTPPSAVFTATEIDAITEAAAAGDEPARAAMETAGTALGIGLASMFALVDPFSVALVGHDEAAFRQLEPPIREALRRHMLDRGSPDIDIACFPDERPFVREGCAISALMVLDDEMADATREAAE